MGKAADSVGARAAAIVAEHGMWEIAPGLTTSEIRDLQNRFDFRFHTDHRAFLAAGVPTGPGWPDWRSDDDDALRAQLERPVRETVEGVREGRIWGQGWGGKRFVGFEEIDYFHYACRHIATTPVLPVHESAFMGQFRSRMGPAVWKVVETGVVLSGNDLETFARRLCGLAVPTPAPPVTGFAPFWYGREPNQWDRGRFSDLGAPPFDADPAVELPARVEPPQDPTAAYAKLGLQLGTMRRHDDLTIDGGTVWSFPVTPGRTAADTWKAVREHFPQTGLWPLIVAQDFWHRIGADENDFTRVSLEDLEARIDAAAWLDELFAERGARNIPRARRTLNRFFHDWAERWPNLGGNEFDTIALVPTRAHWLIPGLLTWTGAVNVDVGGLEHAGMLRRWSAKYRTELVAMDGETLFLALPMSRTVGQALAAALEAYLYCPDIVEQEANDIDGLAQWMVTELWHLWWD